MAVRYERNRKWERAWRQKQSQHSVAIVWMDQDYTHGPVWFPCPSSNLLQLAQKCSKYTYLGGAWSLRPAAVVVSACFLLLSVLYCGADSCTRLHDFILFSISLFSNLTDSSSSLSVVSKEPNWFGEGSLMIACCWRYIEQKLGW